MYCASVLVGVLVGAHEIRIVLSMIQYRFQWNMLFNSHSLTRVLICGQKKEKKIGMRLSLKLSWEKLDEERTGMCAIVNGCANVTAELWWSCCVCTTWFHRWCRTVGLYSIRESKPFLSFNYVHVTIFNVLFVHTFVLFSVIYSSFVLVNPNLCKV